MALEREECVATQGLIAQASELVRLAASIAEGSRDDSKFMEWRDAVHRADVGALIEATARMSSRVGEPTRDLKALREAVIAEIERKNSEAIVETMMKLDASANRLTWASVVLAVIGVVLAAIQVLQAVS
jgi:hypothetical protein